jgi:hypothetical protein
VPGQDLSIERHKPLVDSLSAWINKKGLPFLRKESRRLSSDESHVVTLDDGQFHIEASPQASYGYLYLRAWQLREHRMCPHHQDSLGWDSCSEGFAGCEVEQARKRRPEATPFNGVNRLS